MNTGIGISEKNRKAVVVKLVTLLADEYVLYTKTRNAHWNLVSPDFHSVHVYFETLYEELEEKADSVAERIRKLGHYVPASLKDFLQLTRLTEKLSEPNDSRGYIKELLADHESIIIFIRENIEVINDDYKDAGTADFLTGLMEEHETTAWMLRAHLK
ncbi:MAG TPA: DNA starvation/stationary phase protection protein [Verrucomicrobiae bacterium]|nr:DNA starvation/stationary phase protection protein [Verrucomicrobiae bacterium]